MERISVHVKITGAVHARYQINGAKVWKAGYEKDLATGRGRNYGSGSV